MALSQQHKKKKILGFKYQQHSSIFLKIIYCQIIMLNGRVLTWKNILGEIIQEKQ